MTTLAPTFGDLLYEARCAKGLTQLELADKLGVVQSAVSGWERNHARPGAATVIQLAQILGLAVDEMTVLVSLPVESPRPKPGDPLPPGQRRRVTRKSNGNGTTP